MAEAIRADLAMIGLGGIGSATAFFAARARQRVIGFERFELGGHARGASHDHSRIIRRSYHTEQYVRLTAGAYDAWREVEAASGEQLPVDHGRGRPVPRRRRHRRHHLHLGHGGRRRARSIA